MEITMAKDVKKEEAPVSKLTIFEGECPNCKANKKQSKLAENAYGQVDCQECGKTWNRWKIKHPYSLTLEQAYSEGQYEEDLALKNAKEAIAKAKAAVAKV